MITLRDYQESSIDALFAYWREIGGNPLIELATGLGKSLVVAEIAKRILAQYPTMRIVMLVHVRELVKQNYQELLKAWPEAPVGIYSAGLNSRDVHHRIIYASIQSVYKKAEAFSPRDLILIDEAHLVPAKSEGMYRTFIDGLKEVSDARVAGLTATPYRLDSGSLLGGENPLFDKIVYKYGVGEGTEDGWLTPLTARLGAAEIDVRGVTKRGGEFVAASLQDAANDADLIGRTCDDLVARGADRKGWLAFCAGVDHAEAVAQALRNRGISAECVTGKTGKGERDRLIEGFKRREIRCLTNAMVLTTGFDADHVDLIAMLRPTLSTGLYVQILGRGTRIVRAVRPQINTATSAEDRRAIIAGSSKPNCLVLDYAGNVRRHGPVDAIDIEVRETGSGGEQEGRVDADEVRAKECPGCGELIAANARVCKFCGEEFGEPKHEDTPDGEIAVLTRELEELWLPVAHWSAQIWCRGNDITAVPTLRVDITAGVQSYSEWVPFEHPGARELAAKWWFEHGGEGPVPRTVEDALAAFDDLTRPEAVTLKKDGKYMRINKRRFDAVPA